MFSRLDTLPACDRQTGSHAATAIAEPAMYGYVPRSASKKNLTRMTHSRAHIDSKTDDVTKLLLY